MKSFILCSKEISLLCFLFILVSCKKEIIPPINPPQPLSLKAVWKLKSVIVDGEEELNKVYELGSVNFMTSCGTEVELYSSMTFYFASLSLYGNYIYKSGHTLVSPNADSAYITCLPQHFTSSTLVDDQGDCEMDEESITITYIYHYSPGGFPMYSTHTYEVIELTDSTLKLEGPYPFTSLGSGNNGTYSFSK